MMVSEEVRGNKAPEEKVKQSSLTIKGDQLTMTNGAKEQTMTIKLDPSQSPKAIDMDFVGPLGKQNRRLGIYKLEGDTLTICWVVQAIERPTEFKTSEKAGNLWVFKRM